MNSLNNINKDKILWGIVLLGFFLRVLFILIGARVFFGREDIFVDGDTGTWMFSIQNLIDHGVYTMKMGHEYGYFARTPGYSFFIGIFYLLTGRDWDAAFPLIAWCQVFLDTLAIYIIYLTGLKIFNRDKMTALVLAFLYAAYPFIITWTPVVYSESLSSFFLIAGFYFLVSDEYKCNNLFSGLFLSLSVLTRPQVLVLIPIVGIFILYKYRGNLKILVKHALLYGVTVIIVYGSWPLRNYMMYDKIEFAHDLRSFDVWGIDALAFREYIYSIKAEWEPEFTTILKNERVIFPDVAYRTTNDSIKLERAVYLAQNCGGGFSNWSKYWKEPITGENCNEEIKQLFDELRENQMKYNPVNFYLLIPLQNLTKGLFKFKLYDNDTMAKKIGSLLFFYRSILIFTGLFGAFYIIRKKISEPAIMYVILAYFALLYFLICFGTGPGFRNVEMRYFLPADILLLIPAAIPIKNVALHLMNKFNRN